MLCPVWVVKTVNSKETVYQATMVNGRTSNQPVGTQSVKKKEEKICGCKASVLVKIHYKELDHYRNDSKMEDVFGICAKHAQTLSKGAKIWNQEEKIITTGYQGKPHESTRCKRVSGQRGKVSSVEIVPDVDLVSSVKEDQYLRKVAAIKSQIKRTMNQRNTEGLTVDHWRQCFEEALNEWVVEQVQNS